MISQLLTIKYLFSNASYIFRCNAFKFDKRNFNSEKSIEFTTKKHLKTAQITVELKRFIAEDKSFNNIYKSNQIQEIKTVLALNAGIPLNSIHALELPLNQSSPDMDTDDIFPREQFSFIIFPQIYSKKIIIPFLNHNNTLKIINSDINLTKTVQSK